MCGRFQPLIEYLSEVYEALYLGASDMPRPSDKPDISPTNAYPVIIEREGKPAFIEARWSLIPHWYKKSIKEWRATTFNARSEELKDKPVFRDAWCKAHCLVPVAGFYEWSGPKGHRTKHLITRADNHPLVFAGLWAEATTTDGPVTSFTILTRASGPDMAPIHDREPVTLKPDQWRDWIDLKPVEGITTPASEATFRIADAA